MLETKNKQIYKTATKPNPKTKQQYTDRKNNKITGMTSTDRMLGDKKHAKRTHIRWLQLLVPEDLTPANLDRYLRVHGACELRQVHLYTHV